MSSATKPTANNLDAFFMPFTANRQFKKNPRLLAKAKGVHYWTPEGRKIIDGTAGLWCVNAGHGREEIKAAIAAQLEEMDYAPSFQMGHPKSFELAARHAAMLPGDLNHAFYCNSGSEAVDSALKIALAYWVARGQGQRTRFIGRERGYHGVGFGDDLVEAGDGTHRFDLRHQTNLHRSHSLTHHTQIMRASHERHGAARGCVQGLTSVGGRGTGRRQGRLGGPR